MSIHLKRSTALALTAILLATNLFAQDPDPGPPPVDGGGPGDPDEEVPFDGGLSLLFMAGAGYGAKKAVDYRKALKGSKNSH